MNELTRHVLYHRVYGKCPGGALSAALDPIEFRAPAGKPTGGQWAVDGGSGAKKAPTKAPKGAARHRRTRTAPRRGGYPRLGPNRKYRVQHGDTLWALAEHYLGDGQRWREIAKANHVTDPRKMPTGIDLHIPEKVAAKKVAAAKPKGAAKRAVAKKAAKPTVTPAVVNYEFSQAG